MNLNLKPDIGLVELAQLVMAMVKLRDSRTQLAVARRNERYRYMVPFYSAIVCQDLDSLWEAQQRAA